jgi:hypothetical protein
VGDFFRQASQVLAPSLHEKHCHNHDRSLREYFDQDAFVICLQNRDDQPNQPRWYRLDDLNQTYNLFTPCLGHADIVHTSLSTMLISNEGPPAVHDSTYCIHPLVSTPFSSFRYKLLIAKLIGFDPIDWGPEERFLKTMSGGLSEWTPIYWHGFDNNTLAQETFKNAIAVLILLSQLSNRTLVLPRLVHDSQFESLPVYALVDVATIEDIVSWRFLQQSEVHAHRNVTVEICAKQYFPSNFTLFAEAVIQKCDGRFCAIRDLGMGTINGWHPWHKDVQDVISKVKWCVKNAYVKPSHAYGAYETPCRPGIYDRE